MSNDGFIHKKVRPYPILATLTLNGQPFQAKILKLVEIGFLCEADSHVFRVAEGGQVQFEIPVLGDVVMSKVRVVKTHDQVSLVPVNESGKVENSSGASVGSTELSDKVEKKVRRIIEFHFIELNDQSKTAITVFLKKIKQIV